MVFSISKVPFNGGEIFENLENPAYIDILSDQGESIRSAVKDTVILAASFFLF